MVAIDYRSPATGLRLKREAAALLRAASVYVRKGHCRKANARNTAGELCDPESKRAACWCAQGAMMAGMMHLGLRHPFLHVDANMDNARADAIIEHRTAVHHVARAALRAAADLDEDLTIPNWNDDLVADGAEVAEAMVTAAETLEAAA